MKCDFIKSSSSHILYIRYGETAPNFLLLINYAPTNLLHIQNNISYEGAFRQRTIKVPGALLD